MRRVRRVVLLSLLLLPLAACARETETEAAESYCTEGEDLDQYDNPEGFDRCVEDNMEKAKEFVDCLEEDTGSKDSIQWTFEDEDACRTKIGWTYTY